MDPVTLVLAGVAASLAVRSVAARSVGLGLAVAIGVVGGLLPDLDVLYLLWSPAAYSLNRGGISHSVFALVAFALAVGWVAARWGARSNPTALGHTTACAAAALIAHCVLEIFSTQGIMPFAPVSHVQLRWSLFTNFDALILVACLTPWVLRRRQELDHRARGVVASIGAALLIHAGIHVVAKSQAQDAAAVAELDGGEVWIWPSGPISFRKKAAIIDADVAYVMDFTVFGGGSPEVSEVVPLNTSVEGVAEVLALDTMTRPVARWDVPYATVKLSKDQRFHHVFLGDLKDRAVAVQSAEERYPSPMAYAVAERTLDGAKILFAQWRSRDLPLRPTSEKPPAPKRNSRR